MMNLLKTRKRIAAIVQRNSADISLPQGFPLLVQLEWVLLGFTAVLGILLASILASPEMSVSVLLSVFILGIMRLQKVPQALPHKLLFTGIDFLVLLLPPLIDQRLRMVPPLILLIVVRGCQMFDLPGRLVVAGSALLSTILLMGFPQDAALPLKMTSSGQLALDFSLLARINAISSLSMALIFVLLLINALLEERRSRSQLVAAHEQLRQYALRIESQSALQERNRIAREIHDSLGHTLTAQSIQLDSALLLLQSDRERAQSFLQTSKQLCTQALQEVRQSVGALRFDPLQGKLIGDAIAPLIEDFAATNAIKTDSHLHVVQAIPTAISAALYRIVQEALTNITRHSQATQATIHLFEKDQKVCLVIKDNGKGFNPAQNSTGFGLQSMRERTIALNGRFILVSQPGAGCLITIQLPILPSVS